MNVREYAISLPLKLTTLTIMIARNVSNRVSELYHVVMPVHLNAINVKMRIKNVPLK